MENTNNELKKIDIIPPKIKTITDILSVAIKDPMTEFWEYATPYLDGQPHHIDDLTKVILKENIDPEIIKRLEHICLNLPNIKHIQSDRVFTIVNVDDDKDRSLKESKHYLGPLVKVPVMADGHTVIDGNHRLADDPTWPREILPNIDTEDKRLLASLALNANRRVMPPEEKRQIISVLAYTFHYTIDEVKSFTGLGRSTVDKYFPKECKNQTRSEAGKASGIVRAAKALKQEPITVTPIATSPIAETPITEKEVNANFDNFVLSMEQNPQVKSLVDDPKLSPEQIAEEAQRIKEKKAESRALEHMKEADKTLAKVTRARDKIVAAGEEFPEGLMKAVYGHLGLKGKVDPEKAKAYASILIAVFFQKSLDKDELDADLLQADLWA